MQDEEAIRFSLFVKHDATLPEDFQKVRLNTPCVWHLETLKQRLSGPGVF